MWVEVLSWVAVAGVLSGIFGWCVGAARYDRGHKAGYASGYREGFAVCLKNWTDSRARQVDRVDAMMKRTRSEVHRVIG